MEKKIECDIVRDLLPSYADRLTNETTNKAVEEHLAECPECRETLRMMTEPEPEENHQAGEVDYLKKVRSRTRNIGLICGIVMMIIGMLVVLGQSFLLGSKADPDDIDFNILVENNTVHVSGSVESGSRDIARIIFSDSAGTVNVTVYTAPKSFLKSNTFDEEYTVPAGSVTGVRCDDLILWENGVEINKTTARLYAAMNPYVGDMPSNSRIASILGISDQLGSYSSELQTTEESYGWTIILDQRINVYEEGAALDIMTADSYVMLATINNLGYVTWRYYSTGEGLKEYAVTTEDAAEFAGRSIKECANSPSELQALMQSLNIKWSGVRDSFQETGTFVLDIKNNSDTDIFGIIIDYYLGDVLLGSRSGQMADGSAVGQGDTLSFDFVPDDFPPDTTVIGLSDFSFDMSAIDGNGNRTSICKNVKLPAKYSWAFHYYLTGNYDSGFKLIEE